MANKNHTIDINEKEIGREISKFFRGGKFTSSYKPIVFQSILINIKREKAINVDNIFFISIDDIVKYFLKFNYILLKRFKLKQLNMFHHQVKVYSIIEDYYPKTKKKKLKDEDISEEIIDKIKKLFFRHVIFLLRKDMYIYEFYDKNREKIDLKVDIKNEQEFKSLVEPSSIKYIGFSAKTFTYINRHFPILEKANLGVCTEFLEGFNTVPKLFTKLLVAAESFHRKRNIPTKYKKLLYKYQDYRCFYCGESLKKNPHADHFIPYDYLFDSPIWNIVGACSDCNLQKSNFLVNSEYLERLKKRNRDSDFRKIFGDLIQKHKDGNIDLINRELEQHYYNCSMYFEFIPDF